MGKGYHHSKVQRKPAITAYRGAAGSREARVRRSLENCHGSRRKQIRQAGPAREGERKRRIKIMVKYIDVFVNGNLAYRTVNHKTCKDAIAEAKRLKGCPLIGLRISRNDVITAHFSK